jgi:hypothetical protein
VTVREIHDFARKYTSSILCVVKTQLHKTGLRTGFYLDYDKDFAVSSFAHSSSITFFE